MMELTAQTWLQRLDSACSKLHCNAVHVIIDQVGLDPLVASGIKQMVPAMPWHALFEGWPEAAHGDLSPLLVRIDLDQPLHRFWLEQLISAFGHESRLLVLISRWSFRRLGEYLGQCLQARNGGGSGVLRYYDPRLFPLLFSHVLNAEQQQCLLAPALRWSWLDRDGIPRHLAGTADTDCVDDPLPCELSDRQVDVLCCAADAMEVQDSLRASLPEGWGAEQRFQACYRAVLDASEAGVFAQTRYDAFILEHLQAAQASQGGKA